MGGIGTGTRKGAGEPVGDSSSGRTSGSVELEAAGAMRGWAQPGKRAGIGHTGGLRVQLASGLGVGTGTGAVLGFGAGLG